MAIQPPLSDDAFIKLSSIINRAANELARAHVAYAEDRMRPRHRTSAFRVRDYMGMLLADFEDGPLYGSLQGAGSGMLHHMRVLETEASALIAAIHNQDDVRGALERAA